MNTHILPPASPWDPKQDQTVWLKKVAEIKRNGGFGSHGEISQKIVLLARICILRRVCGTGGLVPWRWDDSGGSLVMDGVTGWWYPLLPPFFSLSPLPTLSSAIPLVFSSCHQDLRVVFFFFSTSN